MDSMLVPGTHKATVMAEIHVSICPGEYCVKEVGRQLEKTRRLPDGDKSLILREECRKRVE